MVTVNRELLWQTRKNALLRGGDDAGLTVHQFLRPNDVAAKRRTNRLVTQTHAKNGQLASKVLNSRHRDTRFKGGAWARGNNQAVGLVGGDLFERDFVVTEGVDISTQLAKVLDDEF